MRTNYHSDQRPAYECSRRADGRATPTCRSVAAATIDDAVVDRLLAALTPARDRRWRWPPPTRSPTGTPAAVRAAELAVERARYEADRAERAFTPSNRRTVWWHGLWKHGGRPNSPPSADAERPRGRRPRGAAAAAGPGRPRSAGRRPARAVVRRRPTSHKDRKRLLRTLIADVTLLPEPDRAQGADRDPLAHRRHRRDHRRPRTPTPAPPNAARHRAVAMVTPPRTHHPHRRVGRRCSTPPGTPPAPAHRSTSKPSSGSATPTTSPPPTPTPTARSASLTPPTGSAAAPAWSTTGSRPANSPPAAAPATGCASPGPSRSKPNAVAASPNPGTSTPPSAGPRPANTPNSPAVSVPTGIITPKDQTDQRNSITDQNIPTHDCRRRSMKHPSPMWPTGSPRRRRRCCWRRSWSRSSTRTATVTVPGVGPRRGGRDSTALLETGLGVGP